MRRRLTVLVLAVTSLVVIAYTVPLALLVQSQADERARTAAEREVQDIARSLVPAASSTGRVDAALAGTVVAVTDGLAILDSQGVVLGDTEFDAEFARWTAEQGASSSRYNEGGDWQVSLPVIGRDGWAVVTAIVPRSELMRGVVQAWLFLGVMGALLVATSLVLADRLGRTLRTPVEELAAVARRIGAGDLDIRAERPGIPELSAIADALNRLAPQLRNLLVSEREAMADLSHRLRTPLAALRLQSESIADPADRAEMSALLDRMQSSVDRLIEDARAVDAEARCDLGAVAARHAEFWSVLADEERRTFHVAIPDRPMEVALLEEDLGDAIDVIIGNVFAHTPRGTALSLTVTSDGAGFQLEVADEGAGFDADSDPLRRGESGGGSTGLGLDIARRIAERVGGTLRIGSSAAGGASVVVALPAQ